MTMYYDPPSKVGFVVTPGNVVVVGPRGRADGTIVNRGEEIDEQGGASTGATVNSGGIENVLSGGYADNVKFAGSHSTLNRAASGLTGAITDWRANGAYSDVGGRRAAPTSLLASISRRALAAMLAVAASLLAPPACRKLQRQQRFSTHRRDQQRRGRRHYHLHVEHHAQFQSAGDPEGYDDQWRRLYALRSQSVSRADGDVGGGPHQ